MDTELGRHKWRFVRGISSSFLRRNPGAMRTIDALSVDRENSNFGGYGNASSARYGVEPR
jgi:hypothetical protein